MEALRPTPGHVVGRPTRLVTMLTLLSAAVFGWSAGCAPATDPQAPSVPSLSADADRLPAAEVTVVSSAGAQRFVVRVAASDATRRRGLMGVADVPAGVGMLFDFGGDGDHGGFWMRDTLVPLDIAFFAADGTLVSAAAMVPCGAGPCPSTFAAGPYRFALEVRAGTFAGLDDDPGPVVLQVPGR